METLQNDIWTRSFGAFISFLFIAFVSWRFIKKHLLRNNLQKSKLIEEAKEREIDIMQKYGLTINGFLPLKCQEKLPEYYKEWEDIAADLPDLNKTRKLRSAVVRLSLLSCDRLEDENLKRRAYIILGMIVHSFINGDKVPWKDLHEKNHSNRKVPYKKENETIAEDDIPLRVLPPQLAIPWYNVCNMVGLPYILTAALDLWNWKLKDPARPIVLNNLTSITTMTGTDTEIFFHMVPCAMQAIAAPLIPRIFTVFRMLEHNDHSSLSEFLVELTDVFCKFKKILAAIRTFVDKDIFYNVYRPLLAGFFPDSIILQLTDSKNNYSTGNKDFPSTVGFDNMERNEKLQTSVHDSLESNEIAKKFYDSTLSSRDNKSAVKCNGLENQDHCASLIDDSNQCASLIDDSNQCASLIDNSNQCASFIDDSNQCASLIDDSNQCASLIDDSNQCASLIDDSNQSSCCKSGMYYNKQYFQEDTSQSCPVESGCDFVAKRLANGDLEVNPKGPSAGQSTMFILFDMLLGIQHLGAGQEFQEEMLYYMPKPHRQIVVDVQQLISKYGTYRDFVIDLKDQNLYKDLLTTFNSCIRSIASFRALHLSIVVTYLVRTKRGTGSTSFRDMLNDMVKGTTNALIHDEVSLQNDE